jgi:ATP/ADP translocase
MGTSRPTRVLRQIVEIKPGERKLARLIFAYFFLIAAPYTMVNALRTSNFLFKEGVGWLPVVYLLAVVATGLIVIMQTKFRVRRSLRALIVPSLVFFAVSGCVLQWLLETEAGRRSAALNYVYWVWASVLITVLITGFWMTVSEVYNPRQARRLMVFLNSGGLSGSVLGGLIVALLSEGRLGPLLLPLACAMLLGCVGVVNAIYRLHESRPAEGGRTGGPIEQAENWGTGILESFRAVRRDRFLALIAAIVAIGIVVSTGIEFQFLSAAYGHYPRQASLQAFFGFFEAALTVFAFVLNLLMAGYLLKRLTAPRTLLLTPAVLLAGSVAVLLAPFGLVPGLLMRGLDEGLSFSVNHPFREIMYIPIPARLRHKAKAFIEMFVGQFAKVAGAVVLLAFALVMNKQVDVLTPRFDPQLARYLSWVLIAFLVAWIWIGRKVGREYLAVLKDNIQPLWEPAELGLAEKVDVEYAKLVFDTVDSRNYSSVLYALHLFDLLAQNRLTPELQKVIAAKTEEIRARALSDRLETGTEALIPATLNELPSDDMRTEIPIILSLEDYQRVMGSYAEKLLEKGAEIEKMELAKAIGLMSPSSALAGCLPRLIGDSSAGVSSLALKSAARLKNEDCIPAIIRKLGLPVTFEDAVEALRAYGDKAVGPLERRLLDRAAAFAERAAAVEALGRIGTRPAVRSLTEELEYGAGDLDKAIIEALDRLRTERGDIPMSTAAARRKTYALIEKFCRDFIDLQERGPGPDDTARRSELLKDLEATFGNIFKLLGLYYPQADIRRAYQNIAVGTRHSVAHAVEWLDNALDKDLHDLVLPIVDDLNPKEKTARLRKVLDDLAARPS